MNLNYDRIKEKIEEDECPIHKKRAEFTQTQKGFSYNTCCKEFGEIVKEKSTIILREETKKILQDGVRKMFKK